MPFVFYTFKRKKGNNMADIWMVTEGATLECTLGTMTSELQIPMSHGSGISGKTQATILDNVVGKNILPFQLCKKSNPPIPCTPVVCMPWIRGKKDFKVKNELALLNICIVPCMLGGVIKIKSK